MKPLVLAVVALSVLALPYLGNTQEKLPQAIKDKAQSEGVVRITVQLAVSWKPLKDLNSPDAKRQHQQIADAQDQLLKELDGTTFKVTHRFELLPAIGLEVNSSALPILEKSKTVQSVRENTMGGLP
jgi:hypothetical protein